MDRTQKPRTSALALPGQNAWRRRACDRTAGLRARLLTGDAEAAQVTRGTFRILYWEHRGQQIFPLPDDQKNSRRRADR
jgi:hypothetical protein